MLDAQDARPAWQKVMEDEEGERVAELRAQKAARGRRS
jgi:hypothetical protein